MIGKLYFYSTARAAFVTVAAYVEEPLVFTQRSVTVPLRRLVAEATGRRVRFRHVRTLGRLEFHLERALLWAQAARPLVVIDVRVFVVEAVVAELLLAAGAEPRAPVELASVHVKHDAAFFFLSKLCVSSHRTRYQ